MGKISTTVVNYFWPQTIFMFGTYREDGTANFSTIGWVTFCWDKDAHIMACLDGEKLTRDRIRATGVFSANLVNPEVLPLADACGLMSGYDPKKAELPIETHPGEVLSVPILTRSPWSYELEVVRTVETEGADIYICKIRNILAEEALLDNAVDIELRMRQAAPVLSTMSRYYLMRDEKLAAWGEPGKSVRPAEESGR